MREKEEDSVILSIKAGQGANMPIGIGFAPWYVIVIFILLQSGVDAMITTGLLFAILAVVLFLPFLVRRVEENLEAFLFFMGILAVTASSRWAPLLVEEALLEPIKITLAVLVAGILFRFLRPAARKAVGIAISRIGLKAFAFIIVVLLGFVSSVITAIIAALLLVEVIDCMRLDRKDEIKLVVVACFAIGVGAVLTPIGEPLSTIVVAKLRGEPYDASFWFLLEEFWRYIVPGILAFGAIAASIVKKGPEGDPMREDREEGIPDILLRTAKTYIFVMALVFLGSGFKPIIDAYISKLPPEGLFWLNSLSAILDNATMAAAEIGPSMSRSQLDFSLISLIVAGGMLIPGNIPNIIAAGKLKIKSKEWLVVGLPIGACAMAVYFVALLLVRA
jgi:predicted cation transporter